MTTSIEPNRSSEYMQLIEQLKHSINSSVDIALRLYEQGKRDGLTNERIREDIEIALSGIIKERQLRNILPLELKRHYTFDPNDSAMIAESDDDGEITYEERLEEVKSIIEKTMYVYVRNLCLAARDENKKLSNEGIQEKVLTSLIKSLLNEGYDNGSREYRQAKKHRTELIERCWPDWVQEPRGKPSKAEREECKDYLGLILNPKK